MQNIANKPKFVVFIRNGRITITLSGDRRKGVAGSRFLQPDARMAQPGKGSQEFFI
jgi:hypothetical protein